jgi:cytochrome P450
MCVGAAQCQRPDGAAACAALARMQRRAGEELSVEVLDKMEVLHACITEALRLHPPLIMLLRYARKAFEVTGAAVASLIQSLLCSPVNACNAFTCT